MCPLFRRCVLQDAGPVHSSQDPLLHEGLPQPEEESPRATMRTRLASGAWTRCTTGENLPGR